MWKFLLPLILLPAFYTLTPGEKSVPAAPAPAEVAAVDTCALLYDSMQLAGKVDYTAFKQAVTGYYKIGQRRRDLLTLVDFSRPSTEERLYVFDLRQRKLLLSSLVAHGRNSGDTYATSFSNEEGSYKSSLGFYLTKESTSKCNITKYF